MSEVDQGKKGTGRLAAAAAAVLLVGWLAGSSGTVATPRMAPQRDPATSRAVADAQDPWKEVGRLVDEQKLQEALDRVVGLREQAAARGDEAAWTRGLVQEAQ